MLEELLQIKKQVDALQSLVSQLIVRQTGRPSGESVCELIITLVCEEFHVSKMDFFSRRKLEKIAWARHTAAGLIWEYEDLNYSEIGRFLRRDHGTVFNSLCRFKDGDCAYGPKYREKVESIRAKLKQSGY